MSQPLYMGFVCKKGKLKTKTKNKTKMIFKQL